MKKLVVFYFFIVLATACKTPATFQDFEKKAAIKNVVDVFSVLADQKKTTEQTFLFTENAIVETVMGGQLVGSIQGRKQIGETFANYLSRFETVYHQNVQQIVDLNGDRASATSYCHVILVGDEGGKKIKTTFYIIYNDDFVLENGRWLIAKRQSNFHIQEKEEIK